MAGRSFIRHTIVRDMGWNHIIREVKKASKGPYTAVGYLEGKEVSPPTKTGSNHEPINNMDDLVLIAIANNFGTEDIPKRAFFSEAFDNNFDDIKNKMRILWNSVLRGKLTTEKALEIGGFYMKSLIEKQIKSGKFTPLNKRTVARKNSSKPLIDRGQLLNSLDQEVNLK